MRPLLARSLRITAIPVAVLFLASCSYGPFSVQTRDLPVSTARTPDDPLYADYQWYLDTVAVPDAWGLYAALADDPVAGVDVRTVGQVPAELSHPLALLRGAVATAFPSSLRTTGSTLHCSTVMNPF